MVSPFRVTFIYQSCHHKFQRSIQFKAINPDGLDEGKQIGPYLWVSPQALWLQVPEVARFLVQDGKEIFIDPVPNIDEDSIRVFLLGSALGALLFQRGHLVLHGNGIQVDGKCLVCVGPSGAGKSTLAAAFRQRGYSLLADDVVPVDAQCRAIPGFPRIKLWQDTADKLGIETQSLRRIRPDMEKFNFPLTEQDPLEPLPIRWVYILGSHQQPTIESTLIKGMRRFQPLYRNTYRVRFLEGMALRPDHLKLCGQLASQIHLTRIIRPERGFELDQLVDYILADIAENP